MQRPRAGLMMIDRARRVVVVTDSSKLGRVAFAQMCPIHLVHELITDDGAAGTAIRDLRDEGVAVTIV